MTTRIELNNHRAGFVSGSLLAWGVLLVSLHTALSKMQAKSFFVFTEILRRSDPLPVDILIDPRAADYLVGVYVVATGATLVVLAVSHLLLFGLNLYTPKAENAPHTSLNTLADLTYEGFLALFLLAAFVVATLPLVYAAVYLQRWLVIGLGASGGFALWTVAISMAIVVGSVLVYCGFLLVRWLKRRFKSEHDVTSFILMHWRRGILYLGLLVLFNFASAMTVATAYTASLTTEKQVYKRSQDSYAEIHMDLGGSTSDLRFLKLCLFRRGGGTEVFLRPLDVVDVGDGRYMTYLSVNEMTDGQYVVRLTYDLWGLMFSSLFDRRIQKTLGLVIVG